MPPTTTPSAPRTLTANVDNLPVTRALHQEQITSPHVAFDWANLTAAYTGFKAMAREQRFDISELAIMTCLQARIYGKPVVLLPFVVLSRFQHHALLYNAEHGVITPEGLAGRRVAIRSYTQTTGAWLRGILAHDHGVDLESVQWVCFDDAHLAEYADPDFVERGPAGATPASLLLEGEIDAAILGMAIPEDKRLRTVFADPEAAALAWYGRSGIVPLNHILVVTEELSRTRPDVVREVFRLFAESKRAAPETRDAPIDFYPVGLEACRPALELAIDYAFEQRIIPRRMDVEELFDETTIGLGS